MKNVRLYYVLIVSFCISGLIFIFGCGTNPTSGGSGSSTTTYNLSVTITPEGWGSVETNPIGRTYASGITVELTATGLGGHVFSSWEGDATGDTSPTQVTMTANKSVKAYFRTATSNQYLLNISVTPEGAGTVEPWGGTYTDGTYVALTAEANTGYSFANWSGSLESLSSTETILMNGTKEAVARFSLISTSPIYITAPANDSVVIEGKYRIKVNYIANTTNIASVEYQISDSPSFPGSGPGANDVYLNYDGLYDNGNGLPPSYMGTRETYNRIRLKYSNGDNSAWSPTVHWIGSAETYTVPLLGTPIIVDGTEESTWNSVPKLQDLIGDNYDLPSVNGSDIDYVKVAKDSTYLYFLVAFVNPPLDSSVFDGSTDVDKGGLVIKMFDEDWGTWQENMIRLMARYEGGIWSRYADYYPNSGSETEIDVANETTSIGVGNVLEMKIPLSVVLSYFNPYSFIVELNVKGVNSNITSDMSPYSRLIL